MPPKPRPAVLSEAEAEFIRAQARLPENRGIRQEIAAELGVTVQAIYQSLKNSNPHVLLLTAQRVAARLSERAGTIAETREKVVAILAKQATP